MRRISIQKNVIRFTICLLVLLSVRSVTAQVKTCQFWSNSNTTYKERLINSSDVITAYDQDGKLCGQTNGTAGYPGSFLIYVHGVYSGSTWPGGAEENSIVTFRINGDLATKTAGSNVWNADESKRCDLDVPVAPPVADAGGPYSGSEGSPVIFDGSGSLYASTYAWTFGDGGNGSGVSPSHTYIDEGSYSVNLTVQNSVGSDNDGTTANISNVAPTATAGSNKTTLNEGESVSFTGSATDPGVNDVLSYSWNFGDGGSSGSQNPTHLFADDGNFNVVLSVNDGDGGIGTDNIGITVNNIPPQNVDAGSNMTVNEGTTVLFSGSATDPGDDVLTYQWNFGDGSTGFGQNASHAYGDNGIYTVTLTVNDGDGGENFDQITVTVNNVAPTANAGGPYQGVLVDTPVQFSGSATDPGSDDVLTYKWDLDDDGQYDDHTGKNPTKTYSSVGTYNISLEVTDDDGGRDTDDAAVQVIAGIAVTIDSRPSGILVKVDGQDYTTPETFYWAPSSSHNVEASLNHYVREGVRQRFVYWSDGGSRIHSITTPGSPATYTAHYAKQYRLIIDKNGVEASAEGGGWYFEGTKATVSIDSTVVSTDGKSRYFFESWEGSGNGSYTGSNNPAQVTMNAPITQTAIWSRQFFLEVISNYGTTTGEGWYDEGTVASFSVSPDTVSGGTGIRRIFEAWDGTGAGSYSGSNAASSVTMNNSITETAEWKQQYYLTMTVNPAEGGTTDPPIPGAWYDENSNVALDATPASEFEWVGWSGDAAGDAIPYNLVMDGPKAVAANFGKQYAITVTTQPEGIPFSVDGTTFTSPQNYLWVQNSLHEVETDSIQPESGGSRLRFRRWSDDGFLVHDYVVPGESDTLIAVFEPDYYVTISIDPANGGTVQPFSAPGGWASGDVPLELLAVGNVAEGYGFWQWSGDTTASSNPLQWNIRSPREITAEFRIGQVTVDTEPSGLTVIADGSTFISPAILLWFPDEIHDIGVDSPQGDSLNTQYVFQSWSDQGSRNHQVVIPQSTPVSYTATFAPFHFLDVISDHGTPIGEGLWAEGSQVNVSVDSLITENGTTRWRFRRWKGTGAGAVTSDRSSIVVTMNNPLTEEAEWDPQYRINTLTSPIYVPDVIFTFDPPGPWYDPGTQVQVGAATSDPNYTFTEWTWNGESSQNNPVTLTVSDAFDLTAHFFTPNIQPEVKAFEVTMLEDEPCRKPYAWLNQYVVDLNDPIESLIIAISQGIHVQARLDTATKEFVVESDTDWNGSETLGISVVDPFGLSAGGTFVVNVVPVNDEPGPFELVSPDHNHTVIGYPLTFTWEHSNNVDAGDEITYEFLFSPQPDLTGPGTITIISVRDTALVSQLHRNGTWYWGVWAVDSFNKRKRSTSIFKLRFPPSGLTAETELRPGEYDLLQNYPNPFNPTTTIPYQLPENSRVLLQIIDLRGAVVRTLVDERMAAGSHRAVWDAKDDGGTPVPSGMYIVRFAAGRNVKIKRIVLLK